MNLTAFSPLQRRKAALWAVGWWTFALLGTYLFWKPIFHYSPFMLFFTATALTASRSGGYWGMAVALGGIGSVLAHPEIESSKLLVPCLSMLFNSGIIIFLGSTVRLGNAERRQDQLFRESLGEAVADFLWSCSPDGTLLSMNDRMQQYFGKTREEIAGEGWKELIHPEDLPAVEKLFGECCVSSDKFSVPLRYRKHDGTYRYFLCRGVPVLGEKKEITRWVGTGTDVHEQQIAEQMRDFVLQREQRARRDAEDASRMKDEFLATLSHELRTPLNAVFGWMQLLKDGDASSEDLREGLDVIDRNVRAQGQLVNDLLDMSGIITGKMRLKVEVVDLPQLVRLALESIRPAVDARQIAMSSRLDADAGPIRGDPARLQQVIWNLLNNAVKFTPRGGQISVVLQRMDSHAELLVVDNGEGIAAEFLPYLFDRFRQADSSPTRAHGGLGLGLAITRQLVELHGGIVKATSEGLGRGATFRIHLPLCAVLPEKNAPVPSEATPQVSLSASTSLNGRRLLVIDDDQDTRDLLRQVLTARGTKVTTAGSASEAWEAIDRDPVDPYDGIICDIGMPTVSGYDFIRKVREMNDPQARLLPALALTAFVHDEDRQKALSAGFNMFVSKPVEPVVLLAAVQRLLDRESPTEETIPFSF